MLPDKNLLFVADTRNHRIVKVDLADGSSSILELTGLPAGRTGFGTIYLRAASVQLAPMADVALKIPLDLPDGARLHPDAPVTLRLENIEGHPLVVDMIVTPNVLDDQAVAEGISTAEDGSGVVRLRLTYMTCHEPDQVCHVHEVRRELPIVLQEDGESEADVVVGE